MSKQAQSNKTPDFEASLQELEGLVEALESGELSLAESLERFKRGVELSKHCHQMLDQARQSVEVLTRPEDEESAEAFDPPEG
jgi:exodeoxyribonuclease VII small subunit